MAKKEEIGIAVGVLVIAGLILWMVTRQPVEAVDPRELAREMVKKARRPHPYGLKGDLDNDGVVTSHDLELLQEVVAWRMPLTVIGQRYGYSPVWARWRADVNDDGEVNALDITALELVMGKGEF